MIELLAIVGSLRRGSLNRRLLLALQTLAPEQTQILEAAISDVPLYNADLDVPESVVRLKSQMAKASGLLVVTPEYNYGVPGVLKNAIDWVSRPAFRSVLANKPVALLGASPSQVGTARAQGQLKQVLLGTVSNLFPYPEVNVGNAGEKLGESGEILDSRTRAQLEGFIKGYRSWVNAQLELVQDA